MRSSCVLLTALVALAAYYVYIPLPSSVSDPWKLMLLDATFRGAQQVVRRSPALLLSLLLTALDGETTLRVPRVRIFLVQRSDRPLRWPIGHGAGSESPS